METAYYKVLSHPDFRWFRAFAALDLVSVAFGEPVTVERPLFYELANIFYIRIFLRHILICFACLSECGLTMIGRIVKS